ncbi:dTMP kinase [Caldiplasma sukawensis]
MTPFIVLEGIDRTGKSSLVDLLYTHISELNRETVKTHEPTERFGMGLNLEGKLKKEEFLILTALFLRDRMFHNVEINRWLGDSKIVLCDRYSLSTVAYQGKYMAEFLGSREAALNYMGMVCKPFHIMPDLTILITIDPEEAARRKTKEDKLNFFENFEFLKDVQENFLTAIQNKILCENTLILDGNRSLDQLFKDILKKIEAFI